MCSFHDSFVLRYIGGIGAFGPEGKGILTLPSGEEYRGEWLNGNKHGIGKCKFFDESIYEGYWKMGEFNGSGTFISGDKSVMYCGWWKDGNVFIWGRGEMNLLLF